MIIVIILNSEIQQTRTHTHARKISTDDIDHRYTQHNKQFQFVDIERENTPRIGLIFFAIFAVYLKFFRRNENKCVTGAKVCTICSVLNVQISSWLGSKSIDFVI